MTKMKASYNKDDVKREMAEVMLTEGTYLWVVDDVAEYSRPAKENWGKGPGNNSAIMPKCVALDPDTQQRVGNARASQFLCLPIVDQENKDTHEPPSDARRNFHAFLTATQPSDFPAEPRKNKGKWMYQGEEIDAESVESIKEELTDKVLAAAVELWNNGTVNSQPLKGLTFFADAVHKDDFINLKKMRPELNDGEGCIAREDFFARKVASADKGNGATGRAKAAKKTSKKASSRRRRR